MSYSVTIHIDDLLSSTSLSGHAFLGIRNGDHTDYIGFHPNSVFDSISADPVPGHINRMDNIIVDDNRTIIRDSAFQQFNTYTFLLSEDQYQNLMNSINSFEEAEIQYDINDYNCVDFVLGQLANIGINIYENPTDGFLPSDLRDEFNRLRLDPMHPDNDAYLDSFGYFDDHEATRPMDNNSSLDILNNSMDNGSNSFQEDNPSPTASNGDIPEEQLEENGELSENQLPDESTGAGETLTTETDEVINLTLSDEPSPLVLMDEASMMQEMTPAEQLAYFRNIEAESAVLLTAITNDPSAITDEVMSFYTSSDMALGVLQNQLHELGYDESANLLNSNPTPENMRRALLEVTEDSSLGVQLTNVVSGQISSLIATHNDFSDIESIAVDVTLSTTLENFTEYGRGNEAAWANSSEEFSNNLQGAAASYLVSSYFSNNDSAAEFLGIYDEDSSAIVNIGVNQFATEIVTEGQEYSRYMNQVQVVLDEKGRPLSDQESFELLMTELRIAS